MEMELVRHSMPEPIVCLVGSLAVPTAMIRSRQTLRELQYLGGVQKIVEFREL